MTAAEAVDKILELSRRLQCIHRRRNDQSIRPADQFFHHLKVILYDAVVVFAVFQCPRASAASDAASDLKADRILEFHFRRRYRFFHGVKRFLGKNIAFTVNGSE